MSVNPEKNCEIGLLLDLYGLLLTERQRDLLDLYYNDDLSLSEVAVECGISRQGVRDALVKAEALLTQFEDALGLLKKQRERQKTADLIRTELEDIPLSGERLEKLERLLDDLSS